MNGFKYSYLMIIIIWCQGLIYTKWPTKDWHIFKRNNFLILTKIFISFQRWYTESLEMVKIWFYDLIQLSTFLEGNIHLCGNQNFYVKELTRIFLLNIQISSESKHRVIHFNVKDPLCINMIKNLVYRFKTRGTETCTIHKAIMAKVFGNRLQRKEGVTGYTRIRVLECSTALHFVCSLDSLHYVSYGCCSIGPGCTGRVRWYVNQVGQGHLI